MTKIITIIEKKRILDFNKKKKKNKKNYRIKIGYYKII